MLADVDNLSSLITGRHQSYFLQDLKTNHDKISDHIFGTKILIFGASGFIASQTIKTLLPYKPKSLVLVDINENSLTELVRLIRNSFKPIDLPDIYPILTDVTHQDMMLIPKLHPDIDIIWNFSAVKHVRSERDPISLARMFNVNVFGMFLIIDVAKRLPNLKSLFSVSTDKAANPVSYMGATKKLMEIVLFSSLPSFASSARFANVCFSSGSLLDSWLKRISSGEPVATPQDTKRYFITPIESGQLCLIASTATNKGLISIPTLKSEFDLQKLDSILLKLLKFLNLEPIFFKDEEAALMSSLRLSKTGKQAVLMTMRDTLGEKPFEEFKAEGEGLQSFSPSIDTISAELLPPKSIQIIRENLLMITNSLDGNIQKKIFEQIVGTWIPNFSHVDSTKTLDSRL